MPAKFGWATLICLTLGVCYFSHLGAIGFVGPDEPRYAWIARAMTETGDWVTPKLYGKPWFEKPPLFYWGAALSFKLLGVSEAAARLPSAICALLATLAMGWLAWRMYGGETARWLLLLLPTTVGMIGFSHAAATDMPFSAMLTIAMVCAAVLLGLVPPRGPANSSPESALPAGRAADSGSPDSENDSTVAPTQKTPWLMLLLFGFFLGLAVLAKGPAAIILCGGAVFFWALFTKRWREAFRLFHPAAIAAFCVTALPWYILCAHRNPDFLRIFVVEHNFKRFLTPEFQHIQPFWFYGPVFLLAFFPWLCLLPPLASVTYSRFKFRRFSEASALLFACWAAWVLLFFTISKSKLPGYILPAVPPVLWILARTCAGLVHHSPAIQRWTGVLFCLAMCGATLGALAVGSWNLRKRSPELDIWYSLSDRLPPFILLIGTFICIAAVLRRKIQMSFALGALSLVLALLTFFNSRIFSLDDLSARAFLQPPGLDRASYPADEVGYYKLRRAYLYQFNYYFHRELPEWRPADTHISWVFVDGKNVQDASAAGLDCPGSSAFTIRTSIVTCQNLASVSHPAGGR